MTELPFLCKNCTNSDCLIWRIYAETSADDGIIYPAIKNCFSFRDRFEGGETLVDLPAKKKNIVPVYCERG